MRLLFHFSIPLDREGVNLHGIFYTALSGHSEDGRRCLPFPLHSAASAEVPLKKQLLTITIILYGLHQVIHIVHNFVHSDFSFVYQVLPDFSKNLSGSANEALSHTKPRNSFT